MEGKDAIPAIVHQYEPVSGVGAASGRRLITRPVLQQRAVELSQLPTIRSIDDDTCAICGDEHFVVGNEPDHEWTNGI